MAAGGLSGPIGDRPTNHIWRKVEMKSKKIMTYTGKEFDLWAPNIEQICIGDIAHALALTNRYGGHTLVPYSVAEHCVRASYIPDDNSKHSLEILLHDAAEAYVGDIVSPQKQALWWKDQDEADEWIYLQSFQDHEDWLLQRIYDAFKLKPAKIRGTADVVKQADLTMLATEVRDLMPVGAADAEIFKPWLEDVRPLRQRIIPWNWQDAERKFLERFEELTK